MPTELKETVTVTRSLSQPLSDLVGFVLALKESGKVTCTISTEDLIKEARAYWNFEHGDD